MHENESTPPSELYSTVLGMAQNYATRKVHQIENGLPIIGDINRIDRAFKYNPIARATRTLGVVAAMSSFEYQNNISRQYININKNICNIDPNDHSYNGKYKAMIRDAKNDSYAGQNFLTHYPSAALYSLQESVVKTPGMNQTQIDQLRNEMLHSIKQTVSYKEAVLVDTKTELIKKFNSTEIDLGMGKKIRINIGNGDLKRVNSEIKRLQDAEKISWNKRIGKRKT